MMLFLLLVVPLQGALQVDGLKQGERFRPYLSSEEANLGSERHGRVVDANTGFPIAGAQVETWTEEISGPGQGFHLVGRSTTRADGGFRVAIRDGAISAEKVLVRAKGYLTFPGTLPDLELVHLMPDPEWQLQLRVVDLMDNPIEGARITSTYSCAHDVPALDLRSGQDGRVKLATYGLQAQTGSLRVQAKGYAARKYVEWRDVLPFAACKDSAVVRLARQAQVGAQILGVDGRVLKNRVLIVHDGEGDHVRTTDKEGRFEVDSRYGAESLQIDVLGKSKRKFVYVGDLPRGRQVSLRVDGDNWPADLPQARLSLGREEGEESAGSVAVSVFHQDGWWINSVDSKSTSFPAGKSLVLIGEAFSAWEQDAFDVDLHAGETLTLYPQRSPQLEILAPDDTRSILVQAGDQSSTWRGDRRLVIPVPRGEELTILVEGARTRRLVLPGIQADASADLRSEACLLPPTRSQLASTFERKTMRVHVLGNGAGTLHAKGPVELETKAVGENQFEVNAPLGLPLLLHYQENGFADCWVSKLGGETNVTMHPAQLASLVIDNKTGVGLTLASIDPGELKGLNPGPFLLDFQLEDGRAGTLSIQLAPGENRTLAISD